MADITCYYEDAAGAQQPILDIGNINYPGFSQYKKIVLTNTSAGELTPSLSFTGDGLWPNTLRIATSLYGVGAHTWSGAIAASATQTLYVYSDCSLPGWSRIWPAGSWGTGTDAAELPGWDAAKVNDGVENVDCFTLTTAAATAYAKLTCSTPMDYTRIQITTDGTAMSAVFDIEYSDNGTVWSKAKTGCNLSGTTQGGVTRKTIWFWWPSVGAHLYWRLLKTDAAAASGDIQEVQFLLFDVHDGYNNGIYGSKTASLVDSVSGEMDAFPVTGSVNIALDLFSRQSFTNFPTGIVGNKTLAVTERIERYGTTIQLYYVPTVHNLDEYSDSWDVQLECRYWNIKALVLPSQRSLLYMSGVDTTLTAQMWGYDQQQLFMEAFGPDFVGWYQRNYDYLNNYGHSFYVLIGDFYYKLDDPSPILVGEEVVAMACRIFPQQEMPGLGREYVMAGEDYYEPYRLPHGTGYIPTEKVDTSTPDQRTLQWQIIPLRRFYRKGPCRPNPYSISAQTDGTYYSGEVYETEEWVDPANTSYTTKWPGYKFTFVKAQSDGYEAYQIQRYYNWWGVVDIDVSAANGYQPTVLQCYADADCLIPVSLNNQSKAGAAGCLEKYINQATAIDAAGKAVLTALGATCYIDGSQFPTPSKLYVRYRASNTYYETL